MSSVNVIACARGAVAPAIQTEPWPTYLASPTRSPGAGELLADEPRLRWRTKAGRAVPGGIAVTEDYVVAGTSDRYVVLLDRQTGETVWRERLAAGVVSVPLVANGVVYAGTGRPNGRVYALRLADGKKQWEAKLEAVTAHLALAEDLLIAPQAGAVTALDARSGAVRWKTKLPGTVRGSPVVIPPHLLVTTVTDSALLLRLADGAVVQRISTRGTVTGAPAASPGAVADSAVRGNVVTATALGEVTSWVIGRDTLERAWTRDVKAPVIGGVSLQGDTAFLITRTGTLWMLPLAGTAEARRLELDIVAVAPPAPFSRGVLVASIPGEVLWVDVGTGRARWIARVEGPLTEPPVVRDGELVLVSGRGDILLYR